MSLLMQALKKAEHAKKQMSPAQQEEHDRTLAGQENTFPAIESGLPYPDKSSAKIEPQLNLPEPGAAGTGHYQIEPAPNELSQQRSSESPLYLSDLESTPDLTLQGSAAQAGHVPTANEPVPTLSDMTFSSASQERHTYVDPPVSSAPKFVETPAPQLRKTETQLKQTPLMAQSILASKQPERSNRTVYWAGGVIVVALCTAAGFYLWQMLQIADLTPKATAPDRAPPGTVSSLANPGAPAASVTAAPAVASATPMTPANNKNAGAGSSDTEHKPLSDELPVIREEPHFSPKQIEQATLLAAANQIKINRTIAPSNVNANLVQAYRLLSAGDANAARPFYDKALKDEPANRDALLGLAAIALKNKQPDQAAAYYSRMLDLNPSDADAVAGLTSLRNGDAEQSESQLKKVLAQNPESGASLFELGNVYMRQSRWSEAQEMFFRAFSTSPDNADFAYNLAVSLDRLEQTRLALDYYQRALSLSAHGSGNFDPDAAQGRIKQLQQIATP